MRARKEYKPGQFQKGHQIKLAPGVYLDGREYSIDRNTGIGGSDVPDVLTLEPYGCARRLFYEKTGQQSDFPVPVTSPHLRRGTLLEPVAADLYAEETGRKVWRTGRAYRSRQQSFMIAHIDRFFSLSNTKRVTKKGLPLEIKCPSKAVFYKIKTEGIPDAYLLQHQHYLHVVRRDWGAISVFCAETTETINKDIAYDEATAKDLIRAEAAFWQGVTERRPPVSLSPDDDRCPRCHWRVTCHGELGVYLQPEPNMVWQTDLSELTQEYLDLREDIEERETILKQLATTIGQKMIAGKIETQNARVYRLQFERRTWDNKKLAKERPELVSEYSNVKAISQLKVLAKHE